jgi:arsenate reductase-like glutaredoxin family protein
VADKIDWVYHRKSCTSCKKAKGFLETSDWGIAREVVDASKDKRGRDAALDLAKSADTVVVARGKKVVTFDMKNAPPDDDILVSYLLGRSGNLRAPTIRKGNMLLVGFGEAAYREVFGPTIKRN